jgi:hypothetical protein
MFAKRHEDGNIDVNLFFISETKMHRKTPDVRRKGKDKAREHYKSTGKYDGKATRRLLAYLEKAKLTPKL